MVRILNRDGKQVTPAVHVVLLEETANWCEEIQARAGRLFGVFLFDKRRHVHAYEFSPSYECHFLKTIFTAEFPNTVQGESDRDDLEDEILKGDRETPPISYMHVHEVNSLPTISLTKWSAKCYREIRDDYDDEDELHEAVMEAMLQAECECESDYYALISRMDVRRVRKTA